MNLNFRKLGVGHPLIILHGLYGAGDNWLTIAKVLSGFCEVYLLDQRNHGDSPHSDDHNYTVLTQDLKDFLEQQGIEKTMILGHSMGGKVAMRFAVDNPSMISKLIIADISPVSYLKDNARNHVSLHENIINALMEVDLLNTRSISDADSQLLEKLPDIRLRKFLMKNLKKGDGETYEWKINLPVLKRNLPAISDGINLAQLQGQGIRSYPVLFIKGEKSDYISSEDVQIIKNIFPLSNMVTIKNAGHWLHAEQPDMFAKVVKRFIIS